MSPMPNHCIECDKPTVNILCDECEEKDPMSNCCTATFTEPGWPDSDICSECHEHAVNIWEKEDE